MATAQVKPTKITLTYKVDAAGKVEFLPSVLHLQKDQLVEFDCPEGELHLHFEPAAAYHPSTYQSGGSPVLVKESVKGMIWCGGTFHLTEGGKSRTITIDPAEKQFGSQNDPPPPTL